MRKLLLTMSFTLLIAFCALAQNIVIKGKVINEEGKPISGASVKVKESPKIGISTSTSGEFSLSVPASAKRLSVSALGFDNSEVAISDNLVITLKSNNQNLDEVVVVGYGTTTKGSYTGSVKTVDMKSFKGKALSNISQALAGEAAGVNVIATSGQPGANATIRIRGFGSVNGNRDPLYVLDGIPYTGNVSSINMDDISNVSVLKDAVATSIYGARGANGVVLLTTKSGKGDKPFIEFDTRLGQNLGLLPRYDVIKSPETYIGLGWKSLYNEGVASGETNPTDYANKNLFSDNGIAPAYNLWNVKNGAELIDPATGKVRDGVTRKYNPENWQKYALQPAWRSESNLRMGGQSGTTSYFSSLGYLKDRGYSVNSDFERITGRLGLTFNPATWLNSSVNLGFTNSTFNQNGQSSDSQSVFWFVDNIPSIYPLFLKDANGNNVPEPIYGGNTYDYGTEGRRFGALANSVGDTYYQLNRILRKEFNGSYKLNVKFTDYLTLENSIGAQYFTQNNINKGSKFYGGSANQGGNLYNDRRQMLTYDLLNLLRFKKSFDLHHLEAFVAHESNYYSQEYLTLGKSKLVDPNITDFNNAIINQPINSYTNTAKLESYFANVNYDFDGKYFLAASIRRDGSSRFKAGHQWANFGSLGASWLISKEDFLKNSKIIKNLKYRVSYGLTGEQNGVGFYPGYDLFSVNNLNDNPAFTFDTKGNPNLTWETSKMFQTGIDFDLSKYVSATVDYYVKNTDNLLFQRRVGPSIGYALITVNDGQLRNQGLEFDVTGHILNHPDYYLDLGINGEMPRNKLTKMPIDPATGKQKLLDIQGLFGRGVGHSLYDFYVRQWAGVDPQTGVGQWTAYYHDDNNNGKADNGEYVTSLTQYQADNPNVSLKKTVTSVFNNATQMFINKSAIPVIRGAINVKGGYKRISVSLQFLYSLGGYGYDATYAGLMNNDIIGSNNWHVDQLKSWSKPGDITDIPRLSNGYDPNVNSTSSRFIYSTNTFGLNNVTVRYTFGNKVLQKLKLSNLNVWLSGDNLWMKTYRKGFYPSFSESGSSSTYQYYPMSNISLGLNVKF